MQTVDMVVQFKTDGKMKLERFRVKTPEGEEKVIKINRILYSDDNEKEGFILFKCQVIVDDILKTCEIKFVKKTTTFYLIKIV